MAPADTTSFTDTKYDEERPDVRVGEKRVLSAEEARFERATVRKVDVRLLIILGALYSISLVDRTNLSTARVAGMARDLKLYVRLTAFARHSS